ncbi:adventurous gliding motility protein AgmC [Myxococcus faecalis]|uniref:adventurous gliding motility protein AgmC n=1 Tax=Myxococcus faecalis TaxID=3115646 RepID=UPI003CEDC4CB
MRLVSCLPLLLLWSSAALAEPDSFGLGDALNGALSVTTANTVINTAMPLALGSARGDRSLAVTSSAAPPVGGLVMVHQTMGFPASTPSGSTGQTSPGGVGRWEFARVSRVTIGSPTVLELSAPLVNPYTAPGAQVVTVPEYSRVTVSSSGSLVARPWDGSSGGIVAFLSTGAVSLEGNISADGAGFRGGAAINNISRSGCAGNDLAPSQGGTFKGEGVVVQRYGTASGRGNLVNAGGGGICHNSGGGGGGHRGFGGTGGRSSSTLDNSRDVGGLGGTLMEYSIVDAFLFGGGGGAGEGDNTVATGGGAGGGAVFFRSASLSGSGSITANGQAALSVTGEDGAGGGGAGGSVIVRTSGTLACKVAVLGGRGGDVRGTTSQFGPGGGGAGGSLLLHGSSVSCDMGSSGGAAGVTSTVGAHGPTHGAGVGGGGDAKLYTFAYATPTRPVITAPTQNQTNVSERPRITGLADPGMRIVIYVDGVEVAQVTSGASGDFSAAVGDGHPPLSSGGHSVTAIADSLGAYSKPADLVAFNVSGPDAGAIPQPIIVVPEEGEVVGPTTYIAGVAPNASTVGLYVDDREEVIVSADAFGRFRYQIPDDAPLGPGPHRVNAHGHAANNQDYGPDSPNTVFEVVEDVDGGTTPPDSGTPDAGSPDAGSPGTGDGGSVFSGDTPVLVVPAEGEVVDPTPLFAGVARPGASVSLEVDGTRVATVTADSTGAFRHSVPTDSALASGEHAVSAYMLNGESGTPGPRSADTGFKVRGPMALDVGCGGCGASPVGAGAWVLLVGGLALLRRRRS